MEIRPAQKQDWDSIWEIFQVNFVVSTNVRAVALWQSLGFTIVGTVPQAFRHRTFGCVDVYVMHRLL